MSTILTGAIGHITSPLVATISAITNSSGAMEFTTASPHLFGNGDYVSFYADVGDVWQTFVGFITVVDATHFILNGSTYIPGGTGTATDLSLTPQILVPTDGDSFSLQLSGMLSAFQGIMDRTQYLQYQLVGNTTIPGNHTFSGTTTFSEATTFSESTTFGGSATVASTSYLALVGREVRRATATPPSSATLATAFFIDVATANVFLVPGTSNANGNHLKLREGTSTAPGGLQVGDWFRIVTPPDGVSAYYYKIYREDGTTALAEIWGRGQYLELQWDGSKWRYIESSPWVPDGTSFPGSNFPGVYYGDGDSGSTGIVLYTTNL